MKIILASGSKTRQEILDRVKLSYEVVTSNAEERSDKENPIDYVKELSQLKATNVADRIEDKDTLIIAADSVIYKDGKKYEKPKDIKEAIKNMQELSNCVNHAITGVTIIDKSKSNLKTFACVTDVYLKKITDEDIKWYVEHEKDLLQKAGYSLEGIMSLFVEKIEGDYYNVLGLPLGKMYSVINEMGYSLKDF